jgi:hypothetical protein
MSEAEEQGTTMTQIREGECRCGSVRFRAEGEPLVTMACHCTGCQRMTASAFSLSALYAATAFEVIAGEPVIGGLHGATRHFFCPSCMSWLFTRPEGMDDLVNVRSTMFGDAGDLAPFVETWTQEKLAFAETGASHSFETFPPMEDYPALLGEYAALRAGEVDSAR